MKNIKTICRVLFILAISSNISFANWCYTEFSPWFWDQDNGWLYIPQCSDEVWSYDQNEWISNPYQSEYINLQEQLFENNTSVTITLYGKSLFDDELENIELIYINKTIISNLPVVPQGSIRWGEESEIIVYNTAITEGNNVVIFLSGESSSASISLNFTDSTSGTFVLFGEILNQSQTIFDGYPAMGQIKGHFTLKKLAIRTCGNE